jgi:RNA recognition motif-containing protein
VQEHEIRENFSGSGTIVRISMPKHTSGNNRSYCYVAFNSKESADAALAAMDGRELWGFELSVSIRIDRIKPKVWSTLENIASPDHSTPDTSERREYLFRNLYGKAHQLTNRRNQVVSHHCKP